MKETASISEPLPSSAHHIRGSVMVLAIRIFLASFLIESLFATLLVLFLFTPDAAVYYTAIFSSLWVLHTVKFIIEIVVILRIVLAWTGTVYYLRDNVLVRYQGVTAVQEDIFDLTHTQAVDVQQSWLGKLLNYGTVHVTLSASGFRSDVTLADVSTPRTYEHWITRFITKDAPK